MRYRRFMTLLALLALVNWNLPQLAYAHGGGGGGGHGGGGFGGGGFGGGHGGGFGGGHMGGFGGGHMGGGFGGFGGGHHGGFGGYSGGHYGGFSGGHYGGFNSGIGTHHSGIGSSTLGGSLHSGGIGHSGLSGAGGLSGLGGHHAAGTVHHNPNSFTSRHVGGHNLTNSAAGNRVMSGYRGVNNSAFTGTHAQGLLTHQANGLSHHSNFLQHHPVSTGNLGRGLATGTTGSFGHHGGMGTGTGAMGHHHGGMSGHHHNFNNRGFFPFFGFGFPFFGFGYPFYGYGFGYPFYGYGLYGLGYGYGYGYGYNPYAYYYPYGYGYGYPYGYGYGMYGNYPANNAPVAQPTTAASDSEVFAQKGENDFKAGDYKAAVYAWRHALVDDPQNGVLMLMLAQGLFATGSFDEAAGAVQQAMLVVPEDQWGVVVANYKELYGKMGDYSTQLKALEKAVKDKPDDPGTRFLLGYHYGFLGYAQHAVKQLDKALELAPADQLAKKLRDQFNAKLDKPAGQAAPDKEAGGDQPKGNQADNKIVADGKAAG